MLPEADQDRFYEAYAATVGQGSLVELRFRLLAAVCGDPALRRYAYESNLETIEPEIARVFKDALTEGDVRLLSRCRVLRGQVVHCDFRGVASTVAPEALFDWFVQFVASGEFQEAQAVFR